MRDWADGLSLFCIEYGCSRDRRRVALGASVFCKALNPSRGRVWQLGELPKLDVAGSTPVVRSNFRSG